MTARIPAVVSIVLAALVTGVAGHAPLAAADMTVEQLLKKHAAARGGDRWNSVQTIESTGMATIFSIPAPFTIVRKRPGMYRFERNVLDDRVISVFDGRTAWWHNPGMGYDWPALTPLPDAAILRREADLEGPLIDPEGKGHQVELVGRGDLDGEDAWELKVTLKDGSEEQWFLDPKSFHAIGRISPDADYGRPLTKTTFFSDFRDTNGIVVPHRIEMEYGTRHELLVIERVRVDVEVDDAQFRLPPPEGMDRLASLAGEWDLTIETRPFPQAPWSERVASSSITMLLGGRMLEERYAYVEGGVPVDAIRTYTYDRFQENYRITDIDSTAGLQNILEGAFEDGRLTAGNVESGTVQSNQRGSIHTRLALFDIEPDAFRIEVDSSTDGGETWTTGARYTYERR